MEHKALTAQLRSIESRSKGELLERAADAIEQLQAELREERYRHDRYVDFEMAQAKELAALKRERDAMLARLLYLGEGCELCQHNGKMVCNDDVDCTVCRQDCICRNCGGQSNFAWKGRAE